MLDKSKKWLPWTLFKGKCDLSNEEILHVLRVVPIGTLTAAGEDGPLAVPVFFAYQAGEIFFRCSSNIITREWVQDQTNACLSILNADNNASEQETVGQYVCAFGQLETFLRPEDIRRAGEQFAEKFHNMSNQDTEVYAKVNCERLLGYEMVMARTN